MFDSLLFPTDGSEGAAVGLGLVLDVADAHDATVHVLNVADTTQDSVVTVQGEVVDVLEREGETVVEDAADRARQRGIDTVTAVHQGEPYSTIVEYAESHDVDVVVMPTHGRQGLERFLLGSTTERVVRRSTVPVLTIRPDDNRPEYPFRNVLVPTDGSDCANQALALGTDLANAEQAALHLLTVVVIATLGEDVGTDAVMTALEERATDLVEAAKAFAEDAGVADVTGTVEYASSVTQGVTSHVEDNDIDLVVLGTHGRTGLDRYVLGSVAETLVRTSATPVLTVRGPTGDE